MIGRGENIVNNNWKKIWSGKKVISSAYSGDEFIRFCELKKANGFDVEVGDEQRYFKAFYKEWCRFYEEAIRIIGRDIDGVFEVGCGSGVNLYMFKNRLENNTRWGGIDYSEAMIKSAIIATGSENFRCCGADEISPTPQYDIVMSDSVFQYFESLEYAETVLRKMIEKSAKLTYLGEIHDKRMERDLLEYRRNKIVDYDIKYKGLNKLFIDREWIVDIANKYNKSVTFSEVNNPEYLNAKYEYNCFIY